MSAPVIKWPGAKWRLAEWILAHTPAHDCYLEPYFGSGAVFFNKAPSSVETLNDRDSLVVNLFRVIRDNPAALEAAIALTPWARAEYDACRRDLAQGDEVERARRLLVAMWQAVGTRRATTEDENSAGNCGWRARDTLHQSPVRTWQRLPERLRVASSRLMDAQIENRPAVGLIERHADPGVLIYADPPYVTETRGKDTRGRRLYAHEMNDEEHIELVRALRAHPGPVLLSGYHCQLYEEHLPWQRLETNVLIQNNQKRRESLYLNPVALARLESQRQQRTLFGTP